MNTPLLNIAVAECVLGWEYEDSSGYWLTGNGPQVLRDWANSTDDALEIMEIMRDVYKLRTTIEFPVRDGGAWWVFMEDPMGTRSYAAYANTWEGAAMKAALKARNVFVD